MDSLVGDRRSLVTEGVSVVGLAACARACVRGRTWRRSILGLDGASSSFHRGASGLHPQHWKYTVDEHVREQQSSLVRHVAQRAGDLGFFYYKQEIYYF